MTDSDFRGPDHAPDVEALDIDGAFRERFPRVAYRYGYLTEVLNDRWADIYSQPVEHLYFLSNPDASSRDEWYVHHRITDRYLLIDGHLDVALFDAREGSRTFGTLIVVELGSIEDGGFAGLLIPPGVWHSFSSRRERLLLMNAKTPSYDRTDPDKSRLPMPNETVDFRWSARGESAVSEASG